MHSALAEFGRTTPLPDLGSKIPGPDVDLTSRKTPAPRLGGKIGLGRPDSREDAAHGVVTAAVVETDALPGGHGRDGDEQEGGQGGVAGSCVGCGGTG